MTPTAHFTTAVFWAIIAFVCGSLPFSLWIGHWVLRADIRAYGDANPGATNVLRAAGKSRTGKAAFALAALLDAFKAAIPVGLAYLWIGIDGWPLAIVAAAPLAGHAFSPLLQGHGGKAVAATFGAWAGLTLWEGPVILGIGLLMTTRITRANGWAVMGAMLLMLAWLLLTPPAWNTLIARPAPSVIGLTWLLHMAILVYKHRSDLATPPVWHLPSTGNSKP